MHLKRTTTLMKDNLIDKYGDDYTSQSSSSASCDPTSDLIQDFHRHRIEQMVNKNMNRDKGYVQSPPHVIYGLPDPNA